MRTLPRLAASTIAISVALLLGGCVEPQPNGTPTPNPSVTPIFESEEAALAAAEAAYAEYVKVANLIAQEGGTNPSRLAPLVTKEWLDKEVSVFEAFATTGNRQTGSSSFRIAELQQLEDDGRGTASVVVNACSDSSGVRFLNAAGDDVTPNDRQNVVALELTFEAIKSGQVTMLLAGSAPWRDSSFC